MTTRGPHPAATVPRPQLPPARLLLGAAAAAVGLFVALHWIVLPGDDLSLAQKNRRSESIAARDSATRLATPLKSAAAHVEGAGHERKQTRALEARRQQAAKTAPRTAGKPIGPAPGTERLPPTEEGARRRTRPHPPTKALLLRRRNHHRLRRPRRRRSACPSFPSFPPSPRCPSRASRTCRSRRYRASRPLRCPRSRETGRRSHRKFFAFAAPHACRHAHRGGEGGQTDRSSVSKPRHSVDPS
jgi:hypothetical protein